MKIETERLLITEFTADMAESVHLNSLDADNRRFVPDEVFETVEEAAETIRFLIGCYRTGEGPLVYPILLKDKTVIGYVQAVPMEDDSWEIGYHVGAAYTKQGYATEAVRAFLPVIMEQLGIRQMIGVCLADNRASVKVMERSGFGKLFEGVGPYQGEERAICRYLYERKA
jgi:RimJ/RimL family protein N-acetyltransferase